jgi:hypothetical protein
MAKMSASEAFVETIVAYGRLRSVPDRRYPLHPDRA